MEREGWVRFWGIPKLHYVRGDRTLCGRYGRGVEGSIEYPPERELCCGLCLKSLTAAARRRRGAGVD